jgi:hypothetical protein
MKFEYSAFDLDQIISLLQKNNITLSFENIDNFQQSLEEILPIMIAARARFKKHFTPWVRVFNYSCVNGSLKSISNYNCYSDAGIMFDEKNKTDIENISKFLSSYRSLYETYFFDISNVFATVITPDEKHIIHSEYSVNYLPLKIFTIDELQRFVSYIPILQFNNLQYTELSELNIVNFIVNADETPQKIECVLSKQHISKLDIFKNYENNDKIEKLVLNSAEDCKIGFYFVGENQNKISLLFNISDKSLIQDELKNIDLPDNTQNILYKLCWENGKLIETTISHLQDIHSEA